ncbi:hypothetical protein CCACVL1_08453 [Corchorus capsularis]|uniref:Uncharacterized protein n=1 Tax=Corchorus capsularis TaxID=210143 RepID=A0A1R3J0K2_COCAP|nr:hypothetical protein CCACVL1_08453 [Corchorus capsularis]
MVEVFAVRAQPRVKQKEHGCCDSYGEVLRSTMHSDDQVSSRM